MWFEEPSRTEILFILKGIEYISYNIININVAELPFINSNTFVGYLHFKDVVQHLHLDLLKNKHLYQLPR